MNTIAFNPGTIAARTKICSLETGAWRANALHRGATADLNLRAASGRAARVTVSLTDGASAGTLDEITKNHAAAYAAHQRLTMPTVQDGMRLLPAGREIEHAAAMQKFAAIHTALVSAFLTEYDDLRQSAPARLGRLFDPLKWPSAGTVARKFHFSTRYLPTPADGAWSEWLEETAAAAAADFRDQLRESLQRVADRCSSDGKLYDTVFSNLRDLVALSSDFNISEDPLITRISALAAPLSENSADSLRENKAARAAAAASANSILTYFGK